MYIHTHTHTHTHIQKHQNLFIQPSLSYLDCFLYQKFALTFNCALYSSYILSGQVGFEPHFTGGVEHF